MRTLGMVKSCISTASVFFPTAGTPSVMLNVRYEHAVSLPHARYRQLRGRVSGVTHVDPDALVMVTSA